MTAKLEIKTKKFQKFEIKIKKFYQNFKKNQKNLKNEQKLEKFFYSRVLQLKNSVAFQLRGASEAGKYGAVAVLVRSPTSHSVYSVHAGFLKYDPEAPKIPGASITVEDAQLLDRFQTRGENLILKLRIDSKPEGKAQSRNLIVDFKGWKYPEQFILIIANLDSWDIGEGALDGASGAALAIQALFTLKNLGFKTKRTIRIVLFSGHEFGGIGAKSFFQNQKNQSIKMILNPGGGAFKPSGLKFKGKFC